MLTFSGAPALSDFRLDKVLAAVRERVPHVTAVDTRYLHFVDVTSPLTDADRKVVEALLRYGPTTHARAPKGDLFLVLPRFGTVSPWASKATDIAHVCGLKHIARIERGIAYYVAANQALKKVRSLLVEFGMTPGSRSRIQAADTHEPDNEWARLLK
jgi:phosphoribosylformylglycinamidine synthase